MRLRIEMLRIIRYMVIVLLTGILACEYVEEVPPGAIENLMKRWVVQAVHIDGQEDIVTDYSNFNLVLNGDNTFTLTDIHGNALSGEWEMQNNNTQLVLNPGASSEIVYQIVDIQPDELILLEEKTNFKDIPATFRYILVPAE